MAVKTRSKSSVRKSTPRAAKVPSKAKFDRVPYTKTELVKWKGFLSWLIVNTFTLGTIFTGFIILVVPTPLPKFMTSTFGVSDRWTPIVLASVAVFCDIADGKLARAWKVQSKVGATFDGLADMMAFGIGPPMYFGIRIAGENDLDVLPLLAITIYVGAAVYRISRFLVLTFSYYNGSFKGMPTNVAGCIFHMCVAVLGFEHWSQPWILCFLGVLMVSSIPFEKPSFLL